MREKKFTRIAAFLLCLCTLLGNVAIVASAAEVADTGEESTSQNENSAAQLSELLNAITYQEYREKYSTINKNGELEWTVAQASEAVEIPISAFTVNSGAALDADAVKSLQDQIAPLADAEEKGELTDEQALELKELREELNGSFYMTERGEGDERAAGLYTPQTGAVSWEVEIPEHARYAVRIEYFPDENRATSIERILKINGKVPFAEARFLTIPKRWVNDYTAAQLVTGKDISAESLMAKADEAGFTGLSVEEDKSGNKYVAVADFPETFTQAMSDFAEDYDVRFFQMDSLKNEIRPTAVQEPEWMTYYLKDSTGYTTDNFEFVLDKTTEDEPLTITLESQNEPMTIKAITLYPLAPVDTYDTYLGKLGEQGVDVEAAGQDVIKLEGELAHVMSNKTIYPVEDRSCAINSPTDVTRSVLNTIGGEKWATAGQWVEYNFTVGSSGMYDIVSRFRQNTLDGMYTCRSMFLYSDKETLEAGKAGYYDGAPFAEALKLTYDYNDNWQVTQLANTEMVLVDSNEDGQLDPKKDNYEKITTNFSVYLEADVVYTVRFEVTLGKMGEIVRDVEEILNSINSDYLEIIKLTGITPDKYRDYGFTQVMPHVMKDMVQRSRELTALAAQLTAIAGEKSSNVATLEKVARLLEEMGTDDDEVAKNLDNLKSYIGTLGTFLSDVRTQPLQLDYIMIQPMGADEPEATPGFFASLMH